MHLRTPPQRATGLREIRRCTVSVASFRLQKNLRKLFGRLHGLHSVEDFLPDSGPESFGRVLLTKLDKILNREQWEKSSAHIRGANEVGLRDLASTLEVFLNCQELPLCFSVIIRSSQEHRIYIPRFEPGAAQRGRILA